MPYAKQVTTLLLLMLFLQGSKCGKKKGDNLPAPLPLKWPDNCLTLDQLTQGKHKEGISFNPTFELGSDPDALLDTKPEKHFDYDSGYDSDPNAKPEANAKIDKLSELDKKEQPPSSDPVKNSTEFDFESIIQTLRAGADKNRNIISKLSGTTWERTLNNNSNSSLSTPEDYVIQGLNIYRAAKKMCNLYGQGGSVFEKKAHEFVLYYASHLEEPETFWIHTIKEINKAVVVHLQVRLFNKEDHKESLDSINEKLRLAENYVGLDDPHYNITTKLTIKGKEFVLEDTKWPPLTEKQKQGYLNRKPEPWYARLSPFEQKFIDAYVGKLSDGNHYIPTQLRGILGCRNGYQKRILTYDKKGKPMVLARYYHSGSLASPIEWPDKATDLTITKDNWEQMTNQEKDLEVVSLNYNMNLLLLDQVREKKIVEDTKQVIGTDRFMNISTNGIGTSFNVAYQFNKLKEEALAYYKDRYPDLAESSIKKPTNQSLFQQLKGFIKNGATKGDNVGIDKDKIKDQQDKNFFTRLARLEESAKTSSFVNNWKQSTSVTDNPNATMCADYITCKIYLHRKGYSPPIAFSCKSGKDRTGIMSFLVDANIIATELNETDSVPCEALSQSGHYGTISAANGGKPGNFGMKPVKGNETVHRHRKLLFPHSARFTKIPLDEELVDLDAVHADEAYTK